MRNIHQEKIPRELIKKVKRTDNTTQYSKLIHMRGNVEVKMLKKRGVRNKSKGEKILWK